MAQPVRMCENSRKEFRAANYPLIRLLSVAKIHSPLPESNATGQWLPCTSKSANDFSAISYFFARKLHKELGVPIGVIAAEWNATPAVSWIPAEGFRDNKELSWGVEDIFNGRPSSKVGKKAWQEYLKGITEWLPKAKKAVAKKETPVDQPEIPTELWITNVVPTKCYNGVINPLVPFAIRGVIWDNIEPGRANGFSHKHKALMSSWRKMWKERSGSSSADFPFYFVQQGPSGKYSDKAEGGGTEAEMREELRKCLGAVIREWS